MSAWSAASTPAAIRSWCRATTATGSGKRQFRVAGFTPTSCRRTDGYGIAGGNGTAGDHLGIDTALVVAQAAHQRVWDVEVAGRGFGIDVGGGAADDPLYHFQPDLANGKSLIEQLELVPRRPARDIQVGAKP